MTSLSDPDEAWRTHALILVEDHGEVLGRGDFGDDSLQTIDDGLGRLLFLVTQVLLVAHVGLLDLGHAFLQLGLFLADGLGR